MSMREPLSLQKEMTMTNRERFVAALTAAYSDLFVPRAEDYKIATLRHTPASLAESMTMQLGTGSANKDGEGIKRACKACGIKHTYRAIQEFLA
jgi:hypothetical protein